MLRMGLRLAESTARRGSATWSVKSRESFIEWDKPTKENNLHFVVNNTRFLILPWVNIKFLASKVLALNAKRISDDWFQIYNHYVYLLETFVEQDRFKGTCYKAALRGVGPLRAGGQLGPGGSDQGHGKTRARSFVPWKYQGRVFVSVEERLQEETERIVRVEAATSTRTMRFIW